MLKWKPRDCEPRIRSMLLYVFWHWPAAGVAAGEYEADEAAFQSALADAAPPGLVATATYRCSGAPWVNGGGRGYEDCYLLEGSAALDPLNEAAVNGRRRQPHDRLATAMGAGAGGLYSLRSGAPAAPPGGDALWFSKARGVPYEDFYRLLQPLTNGSGTTLWRRQMVLGPAPEFCLLGAGSSVPPEDIDHLLVSRTQLWPGSAPRA
jgi:hypothetical protein